MEQIQVSGLKQFGLDYMIYSKCRNINKLFVLSLKNGDVDSKRYCYDEYYMALV